jgi:hypothetical protein
MACYEPLQAWQSHVLKTESGKAVIAFKREQVSNLPYSEIQLPCGKCLGCKYDHAKQWAVRCVHEAQLHESNSFISLTFNDESLYKRRHDCRKCDYFKRKQIRVEQENLTLPEDKHKTANYCHTASLCHKDFTNFMKRLRKAVSPHKIRYFHCGEYGERLQRPHHHACIFGYGFPDKKLWQVRDGVPLYRSKMLKEIWTYGYSSVGEVTWQSAAYVARYTLKKVTGKEADGHYYGLDKETGEYEKIEAEYITMSRRPGIAHHWFEKFPGDIYPKDGVTIGGKMFKTPRYYDRIYELTEPEEFKKIKRKRLKKARDNVTENTYERRRSKRIIAEANQKRLIRSLEK